MNHNLITVWNSAAPFSFSKNVFKMYNIHKYETRSESNNDERLVLFIIFRHIYTSRKNTFHGRILSRLKGNRN